MRVGAKTKARAGLRTLKASLALFRIQTAMALQYRMAALVNSSIGIFWALIEATVYTVFYHYADNRDAAIALSLPQMISYIWLNQVIWGFLSFDIDGDIRNKINNGDVGVELCRPLGLYAHWFARSSAGRMGRSLWRSLAITAAGLAMPLSYRLSGPASASGLLLFLLTATSGFLLASSYQMLMTSVRLGITWGEGPTFILQMVAAVLSGGYLPLQLWPDFMQKFLLWQPFAGLMDLPIRLYVGSMRPEEAPIVLAAQAGWMAVFLAAGMLVMKRKLGGIIVQGG